MKTLLLIFCAFCFSASQKNVLTNHTWQITKISDFKQQRFLQTKTQKVSLSFFGEHLQVISCDTINSTCNFVAPSTMQTKLAFTDNQNCDLPYRQINWYLRYRFSNLVYVLSADTLDLRDQSGVNYTLVKIN